MPNDTLRELKCHVGIGPAVEGEALVADDGFSARYDLDLSLIHI